MALGKNNMNFAYSIFEKLDLPSLVQIGALPSYNANQVENMEVLIPSKKEQYKIGELLVNLDNAITLHQREHFLNIGGFYAKK